MDEQRVRELLQTAIHCLKSYQYGNSSPDLAIECVKELEAALAAPESAASANVEVCGNCGGFLVAWCTTCEAQVEEDARDLPPASAGESFERERHWITEIRCDHERKLDKAFCACGWTGSWEFSVGMAVASWWTHIDAASKTGRAASETQLLTETQVQDIHRIIERWSTDVVNYESAADDINAYLFGGIEQPESRKTGRAQVMLSEEQVRGMCERQAECIIAILGSVYDRQVNHAHPGDETSNRIAGLIKDVVSGVLK